MDELDAIKAVRALLEENPNEPRIIISTQVLRLLLDRATRDHD